MRRAAVQSNMQLYLQQINQTPLLSAEEERALAGRILGHNCAESRDRMIRSNLRLVVAIAKRYAHCGLVLGDLVEEGNIGLMRAVETYDPSHGARFSTYASWWIKQSIRRALMNASQPVRVPAHMVELITKWRRASGELEGRLHRPPTLPELAEAMRLPMKKMRAVRSAVQASQRPEQGSDDGGNRPLRITDLLEDERTPAPDAAAIVADQVAAVRRLLSDIDRREARILRLRYGLDGGEPLTLRQIGEVIGLTRERVRQLEAEALKKLYRRLSGDTPQDRRGSLRASA